ncbi:MAG: hypothetical protein KKA42_04850 [candidate division Zixibacteria bacterium]|nr:hypothetical protein [candidate division Zixibacteria bacterium]
MKTKLLTTGCRTVKTATPLVPLLLLATMSILVGAGASYGETLVHSSARSAAMGGAFTALAEGVNAARYNPANLGLTDFRSDGIELFAVGASITNNSFTLSDYNNYTGAVLSTEDKADIMSKIPTEGLRLDADIEASAASVSYGSFAFSLTGVGAADINLNRDIVDVIFNGNQMDDTIQITGSYSDGTSYAVAGLSWGMPIYSSGNRQLSVGLTAKYIRGIATEELVDLEAQAMTTPLGFTGEGTVVVRTAGGGSGYGLDLGAALQISKDYTVGIRLQNVLGHISWNNNPEEHGYIYNLDLATYDDMEDDDFDDAEDYTIDIEPFRTTMPTKMNVGFANTSGKLIWAIDWTQGLENTPGTSTKPALAMGAEYQLVSFLPVRAGYSVGADKNAAFSFGSGLKFLGFYLDAAVLTGTSGTLYSAKGASFAVSTGMSF